MVIDCKTYGHLWGPWRKDKNGKYRVCVECGKVERG